MTFTPIATTDVDSGSPVTDTLMGLIRSNLDDLDSRVSVGATNAPDHTAGSNLLHANDAVQSTVSLVLIKLKEDRCPRAGSYRISMDVSSNGTPSQAQIFKNGSAVGTLRSGYVGAGISYTTYTEDISAFVEGDLIQVYGEKTFVKNLRFHVAVPDHFITNL